MHSLESTNGRKLIFVFITMAYFNNIKYHQLHTFSMNDVISLSLCLKITPLRIYVPISLPSHLLTDTYADSTT